MKNCAKVMARSQSELHSNKAGYVIFSQWSKTSSIPTTQTVPMFHCLIGMAHPVMIVATLLTEKIAITVAFATATTVKSARHIVASVMKLFAWAAVVNVHIVKNWSAQTALAHVANARISAVKTVLMTVFAQTV